MKHNWATFKVLAIVEFRTGITTYYIVPIKTLTFVENLDFAMKMKNHPFM